MKHADLDAALTAAAGPRVEPAAVRPAETGPAAGWPIALGYASQSLVSRLVLMAGCLLLVALVADGPVRTFAQSLDPSIKAALRMITQFGNSAWPVGTCLLLLAAAEILRRSGQPHPVDELRRFRAMATLVLASVAISGVLASLTKHMIGRIRPSTEPDAMVMDFMVMVFETDWAAFPSGHATTATALAVALSLCFPRLAWAWLTVAAMVALSRALLGVHWLSDSLAGVLLGTAVTLALHRRMAAAGHAFSLPAKAFARIGTSFALCLAGLSARSVGTLSATWRNAWRGSWQR
jgi:membrane-associated phospholipid phosphatase